MLLHITGLLGAAGPCLATPDVHQAWGSGGQVLFLQKMGDVPILKVSERFYINYM